MSIAQYLKIGTAKACFALTRDQLRQGFTQTARHVAYSGSGSAG
jgi:hypothetical protein